MPPLADRMTTRRRLLAAAGAIAVGGCTTIDSTDDGPGSPTGTATDTESPTPTDATDTPDPATVEYVVESGSVPAEFASLTASIRPVFVENTADLGPCYPEIYQGPYAPTITPIQTPAGACYPADADDVDLAARETRTMDATAPASAEGHALLATAVVGTDDGEAITAIKGTGGVRLIEAASPPSGAYGVEVGVEAADADADYDYFVTTGRFEPDR